MAIVFIVTLSIILIPVTVILAICFSNILLADTIIASVLTAILTYTCLHLRPFICIFSAAVMFIAMTLLYMKEKWFTFLSWTSALISGYVAGFFVNDLTGGNRMLSGIIGSFVFTTSLALHEYTKAKMCS